MRFSEELNRYILKLDCMAKELADAAGISAASMSRYRSGNRVPELDSVHFRRLWMRPLHGWRRSGIWKA